MSKVLIETTGLNMAEKLVALVSARALPVAAYANLAEAVEPHKGATLIYSTAYETQVGGSQALLERARKHLPRLVVIINEHARAFSLQEELGGKIVRLDLPNIGEEHQTGALLTSDLVCADLTNMIGVDTSSAQLVTLATRVAKSDVTVFINGPTGTGKEVLARFVHNNSARASKPFIAINCAAIPENMLEAMLFGHEKGAFTGASVGNKGIFRAADGGSLLLDEISEMPIGLQSKLLRVLQERTVTPIGSQTEIPVNVRVIATSNRNMLDQVQAHEFREDLYYRLNVFPLSTHALAERPDDILPLSLALMRRHSEALTTIPWLSADAVKILTEHDWPGNVRELENVIQRALVLHVGGRIELSDIILDQPSLGRVAVQVQQQRMALGLDG